MAENLNLKTVETVDTRPFRKLVMTIGELPTSFIESMTYYELLAWFTNYLETVIIPTVNNNGEAVEELQQKYLELKANTEQEIDDFENEITTAFNTLKNFVDTYFDNLDVQEEINNKLDQMAEDGTLQEIITAYIQANVAWCFDNVAGMKTSTNFVNGSFAQTLGYHTKNDGGTALYKIRTITNDDVVDEKFIIALADDSLIAELITNDVINVKQLGAYGDGTHNDTNVFKAALSKENIQVHIPTGTYIVNESLTLGTGTTLCGDGFSSIIKCGVNIENDYLIIVPVTSLHCTIKDLYIDGDFKCNGIYDGKTTGNRAGIRTHIINVKIYHCNRALLLNAMGSLVDNCQFFGEYSLTNTSSTLVGIHIDGTDNGISNTRVSGFTQYGIYCNNSGNRFDNVKSYLNGTGVYLRGVALSASVLQSEENFHDNFNLTQLFDSNLELTSDEAGIEARNGDTIPTTLNSYSYLTMDYCRNVNIKIAFGTRIMNAETWSCAGKVINMTRCIGINIDGVCQAINSSTSQPVMINGDNLVGNNVTINGHKYPNNLKHQTVTLHATSGTILNSQDGDEYNLTIKPTTTGGATLLWFSYDDAWTTMCLFNMLCEGVKITNIFFRYTVNGQNYSFDLSPFLNEFASNQSLTTVRVNMAEILANNATYQEFISQGATITDKMIFINSNINQSAITNRENIKGLFQVYTNF